MQYDGGENILRDREFSQVVSNHLRLNLNLVKLLSRVDTDNATNHLRNNNHISQMSLDKIRLLIWLGLLLGLSELLDETHWLALQSTVETTTGACVDDITELIGGEIEESVRKNRGLACLFLAKRKIPFEILHRRYVWKAY